MFRKEALRKGVLKTINANTGVMVGTTVHFGAPVPAIRKPPTALWKECKVSGPVRGIKSLGKGIFKLPAAWWLLCR